MLRRLVAAHRNQYYDPDTGHTLDLCYVSDRIIASSMPTSSYRRSWYRMSLADLKGFLDYTYSGNYCIYNLRAEGMGYRPEEFDNKVVFYPIIDHYPPRFVDLVDIVSQIDAYLVQSTNSVAVIHCKAGQGRTGTVACAVLMYREGLTLEGALSRFARQRMKLPDATGGVTIPSQLRYLSYYASWLKRSELLDLDENRAEIVEIQILGATEAHLSDRFQVSINVFDKTSALTRQLHAFTPAEQSSDGGRLLLKPDKPTPFDGDFQVLLQKSHSRVATSSAHAWFNILFETSPLRVRWDQFDGYSGQPFRGFQLFEELLITWRMV